MTLRSVRIFGVRISNLAFDEAVARLGQDLSARGGGCRTVVFPNAATLNIAYEASPYMAALNAADHIFGDGAGVRLAARANRVDLQANLNGTDVIPALIDARPGVRVFLLGGSEAMSQAAADGFVRRFPKAALVGRHHGYFNHADCDDVIAAINAASPDLLLVGFGNPLQEMWLHRHRDRLDARLSAGVGGLFAYWAGTLSRAPRVVRWLGLEWLHILSRQPHKAGRYLVGNPLFLLRVLRRMRQDRVATAADLQHASRR
jgi:N-acetylglucosaminyldiphosphoundecaprenol N-acetyl-beta-D-mannosaminyltransferase